MKSKLIDIIIVKIFLFAEIIGKVHFSNIFLSSNEDNSWENMFVSK